MRTRVSLTILPSSIILLVCFTSWAFFHIWSRHMATELGYRISAEQNTKEEILSENKSLRLEISALKSTKRLEAIAREKLGMDTPRPEQVVYLWVKE
ncbi:MAG TPA: cell division protein FtsL [Deltaproteobacteria bacterium]|nr:cell division protein FtsL [Deltaproteobacteria bacterium]